MIGRLIILLSMMVFAPYGIVHAAPMRCPETMEFDGKVLPFAQGNTAMGSDGSSDDAGAPETKIGKNRRRLVVDLSRHTDRALYFPRYLRCTYGTLVGLNHAIVMLPDDVKSCTKIYQLGTVPNPTLSLECVRANGRTDGATVYKSELLSAATEIDGFRLRMTETEARDVGAAHGMILQSDVKSGETVLTVTPPDGSYPLRLTLSATTATVRKITVIGPKGDTYKNALFFAFYKRFGPTWNSRDSSADGFYFRDIWRAIDEDYDKVQLQYWYSMQDLEYSTEIRFVDLTDPRSKAELPPYWSSPSR